jgi:hypothetical protein
MFIPDYATEMFPTSRNDWYSVDIWSMRSHFKYSKKGKKDREEYSPFHCHWLGHVLFYGSNWYTYS